MGRCCQLVMGPAGAGKSTYCAELVRHCETIRRRVRVVNLDPAAEDPLNYEACADVRDLVRAQDVSEELGYGPNGALLYSMEYLSDHPDWLSDTLSPSDDTDDDYVLLDCPGQIELYSHSPVFRTLTDFLQSRCGYSVVGVYLLDSHFLSDPSKFVAGCLACLSAMVRLEVPHVNVISKCDLLPKDRDGDEEEEDDDMPFPWDVGTESLGAELDKVQGGERMGRLNRAVAGLVEDFAMVGFTRLNLRDPESVERLLIQCDTCVQYGEDLEPRDPADAEEELAAAAGAGEDGGEEETAPEDEGVDHGLEDND